MDAAAETLISAGPLGAVIIALGVAYWRQALTLKATQDARVDDAKKVSNTLIDLNDKWNTTIGALSSAVHQLTDELKDRRRR